MKNRTKIMAFICLLTILLSLLVGCGYDGYAGEHKAAYTLFCTQVPDTRGVRDATIGLDDPQILLLETDSFGRGLYLYIESTGEEISLGIVQRSDGERVYFYPEESTLSFQVPYHWYDLYDHELSDEELKALLGEVCEPEMIDALKALNDWSSPVDEEKLDSAEIRTPVFEYRWSDRTDSVNLTEDEWLSALIPLIIEQGVALEQLPNGEYDNVYFDRAAYMATDAYGRRLYYVQIYYYIYPEITDADIPNVQYFKYILETVAIINPDALYDPETFAVELYEKVNYQDQIREHKIANGWNTPIEEVQK